MIPSKLLLCQPEQAILESVLYAPKPYRTILVEIREDLEGLRPATVSNLVLSLVNADLLERTPDNKYRCTAAGRAAVRGAAAPSGVQVVTVGSGRVVRQQNLLREYVFGPGQLGGVPVSLEFVTLGRGEESTPHAHVGTDTFVYTAGGRVTVNYGKRLDEAVEVGPGDCLHIAPGVPHYVVNHHAEPMTAVVFRLNPQPEVEVYAVPRGRLAPAFVAGRGAVA